MRTAASLARSESSALAAARSRLVLALPARSRSSEAPEAADLPSSSARSARRVRASPALTTAVEPMETKSARSSPPGAPPGAGAGERRGAGEHGLREGGELGIRNWRAGGGGVVRGRALAVLAFQGEREPEESRMETKPTRGTVFEKRNKQFNTNVGGGGNHQRICIRSY